MELLVIHQSFPGQYIRFLNWAMDAKGDIVVRAVGHQRELVEEAIPGSWKYENYRLLSNTRIEINQLADGFIRKTLRAEACAQVLSRWKADGYQPDLVLGHPGWGELLFIRVFWPMVPILTYQEFYYSSTNSDYDFDEELGLSEDADLQQRKVNELKNAHLLMSLQQSTWCISPTHFQRRKLPVQYRSGTSVIHDGIDTVACCPNSVIRQRNFSVCGGRTIIKPESPVVTYINRSLEPYRGIHTMMRSIPLIQKFLPECRIIIVGEKRGPSYGRPCEGEMYWLDFFSKEVNGLIDYNKVFFVGHVEYQRHIEILQRSDCHIYLTYPFVLSWSLLEAMSCACPVVASCTEPVKEVIEHEYNGLLVDFFNPEALASAVARVTKDKELAQRLGANARNTVLKKYEVGSCIEKQFRLMQRVASGSLKGSWAV